MYACTVNNYMLNSEQYEGSALVFSNLPLPIGNAILTSELFKIIVLACSMK